MDFEVLCPCCVLNGKFDELFENKGGTSEPIRNIDLD
jgi:hypothetical protein